MIVPSSDGVEIVLHELVPAADAARQLLIAHATGFHGRAYAPFARHLSGFRVVAPDLRGHGDAGAPADRSFDWEGLADDIGAAVRALDVERPLFAFGHSMGGAVLLLAEARRPGTFRGIFTFEPIVYPPHVPHESERRSRIVEGTKRRRRHFASLQEAYENFSSKPPFDAFEEDSLHAYIEHGFQRCDDGSLVIKMEPEDESRMYQMSPKHPTWDRLHEIACPVLVAVGRSAPGEPAALAPEVAKRLPNGRLEVYEDLGHMGPFEGSARIARRVQEFFDAL